MGNCVIGLVPDLVGAFSRKAGIHCFSRALIESLDQLDANARYVLFVPKACRSDFAHLSSRFRIVEISSLFRGDFGNIVWHLVVLPWLARAHRVQLLHLFAGNRRLSLFPFRQTLVTVHDVYHYKQLKLYGLHRYLYFRIVVCSLLRRQRAIHAVSAATAADLQTFIGVSPEFIQVIHNSFDRFRLQPSAEPPAWADFAHAVPQGPYLLYVSSLDHPRKNHIQLIKAYECVVASYPDAPDLVFAGPDFSSHRVIHDAARNSPVSSRIHLMGFLPDHQLAWLYQHAFAFVHASRFEGFGYPLIEAMSFGLPVVCSNLDVFRELAGDAPLYFDPNDPADIAARLLEVILDASLRNRCAASSARAAAASAASNAPLIFALYERILQSQGLT